MPKAASKYPLHSDFADMQDSKKPVNSRLLFDLSNVITRVLTKRYPVDGTKVSERKYKIPCGDGAEITALMFSPTDKSENDKLPLIINYHGGGFVGAWMPHQKAYCLNFVEELNCRVLFVDYRLALRHPFPVPAEDCYSALEWAAEKADTIGVDSSKIVLFGDSAGGTMAAAVAHMARDRNGPDVCFQMLVYPALDSTLSSESMKKYTDTPTLNSYGTALAWKLYLKNGDCGMKGYAAPLLADCFSNLPPVYIETAEFDSLHDDGVNYADALRKAGIEVILNETKGSFHGFDIQADRQYSKLAHKHRAAVLKDVLQDADTHKESK